MKNTLALALALGVLAGCAEEPAVVDTDTTIVEPAEPVTEPADDLMDDELMEDDVLMEDGEMMEGDAGLSEDDEMMDGDVMEEPMMEEGEMEVE